MRLESPLQKEIIDWLNSLPHQWNVKIILCNKKGTPDLIICYKGLFVAIEVKRPDGKGNKSKWQRYRIKEVRKAGGLAFFAKSLNKVKFKLSKL